MSIHEIDSSIVHHQQILAMSPLPDFLRLRSLIFLAKMQSMRHKRSGQKEDLDKSIVHLTKSILIAPLSWLQYGPSIFQIVYDLTLALLHHPIASYQPENAIFATKCFRHLRDQPHATLGFPRHIVTIALGHALGILVKLEASNVVQNIEEMTVLFHELLTAEDASEGDVTLFSIFLVSFSYSHLWTLDQPLAQVIECLRLAKMRKPELRVVHICLAYCLCVRYNMMNVNDDYEEAASIMDKFIASSFPGDIQNKRVASVQEFLAETAVLHL
ncbi:hypothetical protein EDB83DRAFT_2649842 [Lactarius deliciosus]|nr:hypothetical protein EDB83DRAFT_2649842 [Lactarius deliciosus]